LALKIDAPNLTLQRLGKPMSVRTLGLSWWYAAPATFGGVQMVALPLLIPSHTFDLTGSASHSGGVLAMIGLAGFVAPLIGGYADRARAHARMQILALLGYALAFALLAFVPAIAAVYVATAMIGLCSITMLSINPTFVVAAGYDDAEKTLRLTRMNQFIFVGAIVAGALLSLLGGMGKQVAFVAMMFAALAAMIVTRKDNSRASTRMQKAQDAPQEQDKAAPKGKMSFGFLIFLFAVFGGMVASANQVAQGPNVLENVYSMDPSWIAGMLTVSAIVSLVTLDLGGRLMQKADAGAIWLVGLAIYAMASGGMALMVGAGAAAGVIALVLQLIFMQGLSLVDMAKPALAERATTLAPSTTQGVLLFAIAGGYSAGSIMGGQVGEASGLAAIPAFASIVALGTLALAMLALRMMRRAKE
jgi:predicted MFS family arabinose efflux permease